MKQKHIEQAKDTLNKLLADKRISAEGKTKLTEDYKQLQRLLGKLEKKHMHIAAFGRVSVGKSAILNALVGEKVFSVSVLHGHTKESGQTLWQQFDGGGVYLIDTPGIDEVNGEEHERIAKEVAAMADIILFICDGDLTDIEFQAMKNLKTNGQPMILVVNKADRLGGLERSELLTHLQNRCKDLVPMERVVAVSALPDKQIEIVELMDGTEEERKITPPPDVGALRDLLWRLVKNNGETYIALNAGIFAEKVSKQLWSEVIELRKEVVEKIIKYYASAKAALIALNPFPVVDLLAIGSDVAMIVHLSKAYGIEITKHEAGELLKTIATQSAVLTGTVLGTHLIYSGLKVLTGGLSWVLTAGTQAGVAYYGSNLIGRVAEKYFAQGASWGQGGAKALVAEIVADLDKDALLDYGKIFKTEN